MTRLIALFKGIPSTFARMGGYWGGIIMAWRTKD